MPCASLLYTKPPESSEGLVLPLKALAERFEVPLAEFGILWKFVGVGQGHRDEPSLEGLECGSIDASQASEEVPAAFPGEAPYLLSKASTTTPTGTELVPCLGVLKREC